MRGSQRRVVVAAPGKVNLQLSIGPLRADGFHEVATLYQAVSVSDEVIAAPANRLLVTAEGETAGVPLDASNLSARAAQLVAAEIGVDPRVHLHLRKRIPVAGGMAGGSADAAAALVACDRLWNAGLPEARLFDLAAELGSDVPFMLLGGTAIGTGRGENLAPVPCTGTYHWVFGLADAGLSTPSVYREWDRLGGSAIHAGAPAVSRRLLDSVASGNLRAIGAALQNDADAAALSLRPELATVLDTGRHAGALGAIVSGTGPTCAFLVADTETAERLAAALRRCCRQVRHAQGPVAGPLAQRDSDESRRRPQPSVVG